MDYGCGGAIQRGERLRGRNPNVWDHTSVATRLRLLRECVPVTLSIMASNDKACRQTSGMPLLAGEVPADVCGLS